MSERTGYVCHNCGTGLEAVPGSKMFRCPFCKAQRRKPTHPALMAPWRWMEHLQAGGRVP